MCMPVKLAGEAAYMVHKQTNFCWGRIVVLPVPSCRILQTAQAAVSIQQRHEKPPSPAWVTVRIKWCVLPAFSMCPFRGKMPLTGSSPLILTLLLSWVNTAVTFSPGISDREYTRSATEMSHFLAFRLCLLGEHPKEGAVGDGEISFTWCWLLWV